MILLNSRELAGRKAIAANAGLRVLDVRRNCLGAAGSNAFAAAMSENSTLQHLRIEDVHIETQQHCRFVLLVLLA